MENNDENNSHATTKSSFEFPLSPKSWEIMVQRFKELHPSGNDIVEKMTQREELLGNREDTKEKANHVAAYSIAPPMIMEPIITHNMSSMQKINAVQKYLNQLQYNHTGTQFFEIKMNRSIARLYDTAKNMIKYSLPIKCLEAVILSLYLTANIKNISRFTIRFKSKFGNTKHKHIVLGICSNSNYGSIGLSRRKTLMNKPITFKSLTDLILEFRNCYEQCFHSLSKVKLSSFISTDIHSCDKIEWNHFVVSLSKHSDGEIRNILEKYSREMRRKTDLL